MLYYKYKNVIHISGSMNTILKILSFQICGKIYWLALLGRNPWNIAEHANLHSYLEKAYDV